MKRLRQVFGLLALFAGCDDSFAKGWLVDRTRVLGARIEATTEPGRASIAPGERARVSWLIGAPNGTGTLGWSFALCAAPAGIVPDPRCEGDVLATGRGRSDGELAVMEVDVPKVVLGDVRELLFIAAFCERGDAALEPRLFEGTCAGGEAIRASVNIRMAAAGHNGNPAIAPEAIRFDGSTLPPAKARSGPSCMSSVEAPVVAPDSEHRITFAAQGDERESVAGASVESLLVSGVATGGTLERQYSSFEPDAVLPSEATTSWTAPPRETVAESGRLVEFYFVLRDGRGGTAFARRTVCVRRDPEP